MNKIITTIYTTLLASLLVVTAAFGGERAESLVIDHNCTDLTRIPPEWIESARSQMLMYYGHASHGEQITGGLNLIDEGDPLFAFEMAYRVLPDYNETFCVNDDLGVTPDYYWATQTGIDRTRAVLEAYPEINISMFMWCIELNTWTAQQVEAYFAAIELLEAEFPGVTFIYTTGNAQFMYGEGYNRWQRNEQIRAWCIANKKVLFDFADMDAWWYNPVTPGWEQNTYQYNGETVPVQHSHYYGDDWGHTTFESCEQKGNAMWWLTAVLIGWTTSGPTGTEDTPIASILGQNFPNPFNPNTRIAFSIEKAGHVRLDLFDPAGRFVKTLVDEDLPASRHEVNWNGKDGAGRVAASGVYFYTIVTDGNRYTKKMILLR
jgi:hypothetical protein